MGILSAPCWLPMKNKKKILIKTARSGAPIAVVDGVNFHSVYDPVREAKRFINQVFNDSVPGTIILAGAGLGYLQEELKSRFPEARVLPLYYTTELYQLSDRAGQQAWHPGAAVSLLAFLRQNLTELDLSHLQVLKWPAAANIFPEYAAEIDKQLSHVIKELSGSFITTYALGKLWLRNSFRNYLYLDRVFSFRAVGRGKPVVLAGSGPSLDEATGLIKTYRRQISVWALPSAIPCLHTAGIFPDLVILTDPGYYSLVHLQDLAVYPTKLLMPLSAAAGTWRLQTATAFIQQPHFFEQALIQTLPQTCPEIPPGGTVAATALELAQLYSGSLVLTAGLDFCCQDIRSHAFPSAFYRLLEVDADRTGPAYSRVYQRTRQLYPERDVSTNTRTSRPLRTYAGWFNSLPLTKQQRIRRIRGRYTTAFQLQAVSRAELTFLTTGTPELLPPLFTALTEYPVFSRRREIALKLLAEWQLVIKQAKQHWEMATGSRGALDNQDLAYKLCYFTDLDKLNKASGLLANGQTAPARDKFLELLQGAAGFLQELVSKVEGESGNG